MSNMPALADIKFNQACRKRVLLQVGRWQLQ